MTTKVKLIAIKTIYTGGDISPETGKAALITIHPGEEFEIEAGTAARLVSTGWATDETTVTTKLDAVGGDGVGAAGKRK